MKSCVPNLQYCFLSPQYLYPHYLPAKLYSETGLKDKAEIEIYVS
jgi:hypothetical protein